MDYIKKLENFKAKSSIKAELNHLNKTPVILATIGQNIAAQLMHGNKNHLVSMVEALSNKDGSLNQHAKLIKDYLNTHEGLDVTFSKKKGVKVHGKPLAVNCYASFIEEKEIDKAIQKFDAKAKREEAKANRGNDADLKAQAEKLATMLKGYTLEQAKAIMLLAEQALVADIVANQEKTEGIELPSLETPFKEAV